MIAPPLLLVLLAFWQDAPKPAMIPPAEVRSDFLGMLDRPRVPADPVPSATPVRDLPEGLVEETFTIATQVWPDGRLERVPVLIVRPKTVETKLPAVIALHGTGGSKEGMRDWLVKLAHRGIIGVAIDGRYHGDRGGHTTIPLKSYNDAIIKAWRTVPGEPQEHPFYYDTCWDVWRLIDYLQKRPDIDPERIGLFGISKGGIETWLAAAADPRVKVTVPAISVQTFRWGLDHDSWHARANTIATSHRVAANDRGETDVTRGTCVALWNKILPGILDRFDGPSMIRLFAGRPLLIIGGEKDPNCPIEGAKIAFASAEAAYKEAGCPEKLKIDIAPGVAHAITDAQQAEILDWFAKWL